MTKFKIGFAIMMAWACIAVGSAQQKTSVTAKDFKALTGSWQGSLTYLDYSSGQPYTMPANVEIQRLGRTSQFLVSNIYPDEKSANSSDTLTISADGHYIDGARVKSKKKLKAGGMEIITEESGQDGNDNKPAQFRHTYTISKTVFKKRKEVLFEGETKWIMRHEYAYKRKANR